MTPEMAFECLLVSDDPSVFCTMHRILKDFSITTNLCPSAAKAIDMLGEGSTDLIVIDWDNESSGELIQEVSLSRLRQKPTILAVAGEDQPTTGAHVLVHKPVTREEGTKSMRTAYSRMIEDFRKHVRYALMSPVLATDENGRMLQVTVTNIGDGGVGLSTKDTLGRGQILSFRLPLPGIGKEISVQARVVWTRDYGVGGCEFVRIPPIDLQIMHGWLRSRCRIRKPLID